MTENFDSCDYVVPLLEAYYDQELSPSEAARIEAHLAHCSQCEKSLKETDALVTALHSMPRVNKPNDLVADWQTFSKKLDASRIQHGKRFYANRYWQIGAAAALAIFAVATIILSKQLFDRNGVPAIPAKVAQNSNLTQSNIDEDEPADLIALSPIDSSPNNEESGASNDMDISTDKDGLYALKL